MKSADILEPGVDLVRFAAEVCLARLARPELRALQWRDLAAVALRAGFFEDDEPEDRSRRESDRGEAYAQRLRRVLRQVPTTKTEHAEVLYDLLRKLDSYAAVVADTSGDVQPWDLPFLMAYAASIDPVEREGAIEAALFLELAASGPTRTNPEALVRARAGIAYLWQARRALPAYRFRSAYPTRPGLPTHSELTIGEVIDEVVDDLCSVAELTSLRGGSEAQRLLGAFADESLPTIERHLFGTRTRYDGGATNTHFGSPGAWRLLRAITHILRIAHEPHGPKRVWGLSANDPRLEEVRRRCQNIVRTIVESEPLAVGYRSRSFIVECARYMERLTENDYWTSEMRRRVIDGTTKVEPVFDSHTLTPRERTYAAVVAATRIVGVPLEELSKAPGAIAESTLNQLDGFVVEVEDALTRQASDARPFSDISASHASLRFALAQIRSCRIRARARFADDGSDLADSRTRFDPSTDRELTGPGRQEPGRVVHTDQVMSHADTDPIAVVRESLKAATSIGVFDRLPTEIVPAVVDVITQTALAVDGSARREALDALQRAGLASEAARAFMYIVRHVHALTDKSVASYLRQQSGDIVDPGLDWLIDQGIFCACHLGSLDVLEDVLGEAGLGDSSALVGNSTERIARDPRRWLRTCAIIGIAELSSTINDQPRTKRDATRARILERLPSRLRELNATIVRRPERGPQPGRPTWEHAATDQHILVTRRVGEIRSLALLLAMLRSDGDPSVPMLAAFAGIDDGDEEIANEVPENLRRLLADHQSSTVRFSSSLSRHAEVGVFPDLITWQIAQWGLERCATRTYPSPDGVRLVKPLDAAGRAEMRMRRKVAAVLEAR